MPTLLTPEEIDKLNYEWSIKPWGDRWVVTKNTKTLKMHISPYDFYRFYCGKQPTGYFSHTTYHGAADFKYMVYLTRSRHVCKPCANAFREYTGMKENNTL